MTPTRAATAASDRRSGAADDSFDAIICTQTLQLIFDFTAAMRTLHRILKPDGVLLLTVPGITPVSAGRWWGYTWLWSFTEISIGRLLEQTFGAKTFDIQTSGNVLTATSFLQGLAAEELTVEELQAFDPNYPVIVGARARRPPHESAPA